MADYETKIRKKFVYHGAGYPVVLHHVPMIKLGREWALNINPSIIERLIFEDLPHQPSRLTGYQVRFIRAYTDMTLKAFAERFGVSHPAVKKWENAEDGPTNMSWSTEKDIRLFVLEHSKAGARDFQACYNELVTEATAPPAPIHIDVESMAIA